ncbi:hypothetical protein SDC9_166922 [bioreactor metagenome]|uniref:Uncharacterized protein n=1 Tax=bioreactor metagenome TaxID=1076179 RepID=A0A645FYB9_9ZZZZ
MIPKSDLRIRGQVPQTEIITGIVERDLAQDLSIPLPVVQNVSDRIRITGRIVRFGFQQHWWLCQGHTHPVLTSERVVVLNLKEVRAVHRSGQAEAPNVPGAIRVHPGPIIPVRIVQLITQTRTPGISRAFRADENPVTHFRAKGPVIHLTIGVNVSPTRTDQQPCAARIGLQCRRPVAEVEINTVAVVAGLRYINPSI